MFDQSEIDQFKLSMDMYRAGQPKTRAKAQPKKKKGFLLDQISTVGGILGGIGGSFIAPIAGTAGGAAAGSALGETLENALMGESLGKNVVKEGVLGGVLGAGPLRLGSKVVSKIAPRAGKAIESGGKRLLGTQANLTRAEGRKMGVTPADTLGEINRRTGLTSMNKMADVSKNVTGESGVLSELTRNAIGNTKGVDIGNLRSLTDDLMTDLAPSVTGSVRKNVQEQVKNSLVKAYGGSKGSLSTLANPYDAFDVAKTFEANAARLRSLPTPTAADNELSRVYSSLAKEINTRLFNAPGVAEGIVQARPAAVEAFKGLSKSAPSRSERNAYERLAKETESLTDVLSTRSAQSPFVQLGKIDEATARASGGAGAQIGDNMQGLGKLFQRPTNLLAVPLNAATPAAGGLATRVGRNLQGNGAPITAKGIAGRVGAGGLASALLGAETQGATVPTEPQSTAPPQPIAPGTPSLEQALQSQDSSPFAAGNLQNSIQSILANGGEMKDAVAFVSLAEALQKMQGGTAQKPLTASQATRAAAGNNALRDIPMIQEAIESGTLGGAKALPGSGTQIGRRLLGTENLDAALFNIADNILRARSGAAAPEAEVKRFVDTFLPAPTDSKKAKIDKLDRAIRELQGYVNPIAASADTLEEAIL